MYKDCKKKTKQTQPTKKTPQKQNTTNKKTPKQTSTHPPTNQNKMPPPQKTQTPQVQNIALQKTRPFRVEPSLEIEEQKLGDA